MFKKSSICVVLFFFVLSLGFSGVERIRVVEHLVWAETPGHQIPWELTIADDTKITAFKTDPLLSFHVQASPDAKALFFELWSQAQYKFTSISPRIAQGTLWFKLISNVIPNNIKVYNGTTLLHDNETNNSGDFDVVPHRSRRDVKVIMRRNNLDWWFVEYADTGMAVPEDIALPIMNKLINRGFNVEVWVEGEVQAVSHIRLAPIVFEVTRLVEK